MRIKIVNIGSSKGIIIPNSILNECGIRNEVEIHVSDKKLIITPINAPRVGWKKKFERQTKNKVENDKILKDFENLNNKWDENEWKW
jgi:antitoxin MazE